MKILLVILQLATAIINKLPARKKKKLEEGEE